MTGARSVASVGIMEHGIRRYWTGRVGRVTHLLMTAVMAPLSALFGVLVRTRNRAWDTGLLAGRRAPIPVVSIGNLSVGGSGKTPTTRWVVTRLRARGARPAVVTRGYGEDETMLHRRWYADVPVVVNADRIEGVGEAARLGARIAVLDDGFQHRRLIRDADIVLLSSDDPFPPRLLPRGPYREPLSSLGRASLILVTGRGREGEEKADALLDVLRAIPRHPPVGTLYLRPGGWRSLSGDDVEPPAAEAPLLAVASVANPEAFVRILPTADVELMAFADHHPYMAADVARIVERADGRVIVTTEKDAVKLEAFEAGFAGKPPRVLTLDVVPGAGVERLLDRLLGRVLGRAGVET